VSTDRQTYSLFEYDADAFRGNRFIRADLRRASSQRTINPHGSFPRIDSHTVRVYSRYEEKAVVVRYTKRIERGKRNVAQEFRVDKNNLTAWRPRTSRVFSANVKRDCLGRACSFDGRRYYYNSSGFYRRRRPVVSRRSAYVARTVSVIIRAWTFYVYI